MRSSPLPCYLVPLRPKYLPQHPILKYPQPIFLPQCETPNFTPAQNNSQNYISVSYVYWTVHRLDSWIKRDQRNVTCCSISLFNAGHASDVNTSIVRSLRLICWVISWVVLLWFDMCWRYVVVWLLWCGIRMQAEALLQPAHGYHTTTAKPQRNTNTLRTRAIQPMK